MKIIDAHTHIYNLNGDFTPLYTLAKRLGFDRLTVLSLQCLDPLQNILCALCKLKNPGTTYAFGGLDYQTGQDFLSQAKNLKAIGFDGIKMLEGKPTVRKMLNIALDDPVYGEYYTYLEETGFPVLFHAADPPEFWDKAKVPGWAVKNGWFYDETFVPYEQFYHEVENILNKHPKLKITLAHFFFLSGDPVRAQKFLDDHPSVFFDLAAGIEMYENFSSAPDFWRAFFIKNSKRIIFGTDSTDAEISSGCAEMEIKFLCSGNEIEILGKKLCGIALPEETQERIFSLNYQDFAGKTPAKINRDLLLQAAASMRAENLVEQIYNYT